MNNQVTQGMVCTYCSQNRQLAASQQALLRFGTLVICGNCGSDWGHAQEQSIPEELAGTLRHLVQQCPLTLQPAKAPALEVRYGQHVYEHQLRLSRRDFNLPQNRQDDAGMLIVDLVWFFLDAKRFRDVGDQVASIDKHSVASVPFSVDRILKPFLQQGFDITDTNLKAKEQGQGRYFVRLSLTIPSQDKILMIRSQVMWDAK